MKVDLFLGGPLGLWVLDQVDAKDIGTVYTCTPEIISRARKLGMSGAKGDIGFSMHYPYLLKPDVISTYKAIYNIHPGLLPYGRSYYPVFWSLWQNEPTGCTLHIIDDGIDTGPIIAQKRVVKYEWDTGGSLHRRVSEAEKALFLEYWPRIIGGEKFIAVPQSDGGSLHYRRDFFELKKRARYEQMNGSQIIHLITCLSHEQYTGLEVIIGGRRYEISAREV